MTHAFFAETYLGGIAACMALSATALFVRPGMWLYVLLSLRCYALLVLGYSIGGFLSAKLVLGIGAMVEICVLIGPPLDLGVAGLVLALYCAAQAWPNFFGASALVDSSPLPNAEDLVSLALVLAQSALLTSWLSRAAAHLAEQAEAIRIQEANLDTLAELNLNLQGYARTVDEDSSERERNRISREIHDISGYIFTNLIALMDAAGSMRRDDQAGLTDILITARRTRPRRACARRGSPCASFASEQPELTQTARRPIFKIVSIFRKITGIEVELNLGQPARTSWPTTSTSPSTAPCRRR